MKLLKQFFLVLATLVLYTSCESGPKYILIGSRAWNLPYALHEYVYESMISEDLKEAINISDEYKTPDLCKTELCFEILKIIYRAIQKPTESEFLEAKNNLVSGNARLDDFLIIARSKFCNQKLTQENLEIYSLRSSIKNIGNKAKWTKEKIDLEIEGIIQQINELLNDKAAAFINLKRITKKHKSNTESLEMECERLAENLRQEEINNEKLIENTDELENELKKALDYYEILSADQKPYISDTMALSSLAIVSLAGLIWLNAQQIPLLTSYIGLK